MDQFDARAVMAARIAEECDTDGRTPPRSPPARPGEPQRPTAPADRSPAVGRQAPPPVAAARSRTS
jgi:hypothetical protein